MATSFKTTLLRIFTWWNGQTVNTGYWTRRYGQFVGEDEFGNRYYRKPGIDPVLHFERRWVIYAGESDGSLTPPGWYGWLHHTVDVPPTDETYVPREWQKPYVPNMTGTPDAYRPQGSILKSGKRQPAGGDYGAWTPS
jgi:NADH:ubiquinone oxidoreductase subunit